MAGPKFKDPPDKVRGITTTNMASRRTSSQPEARHKQRAAPKPFLLEGDMLAVKNIDDVDWEFRYDRKRWVARAGGPTEYIPFPAVVNRMGDPRSVPGEMVSYSAEDGTRGVCFTRYEEIARLFAVYGIENEDVEKMVQFAPKLEVRTLQGDLITFPAQNPEMVAFPVPNVPVPGKENVDLRRRAEEQDATISTLQSQLDDMQRLVEERLGGRGAADEDDGDTIAAALAAGAATDTGPQTTFQ